VDAADGYNSKEIKMALIETKLIDKIEIVQDGTMQVREATRILRDGDEIAKTYRRWSFAPGSDVSEMPANVQAIAQAAWTPEVIAAYQAAQQANQPGV
jgi:hypothetical protein